LSDPLVSILSRPGWLAVLGGVALLSFVVVNVLVWASLKPKPRGPSVAQPRLQSIDDVIVKGGHRHEVLLTVERNECEEPLTIQVHGLPPDMPAPPLTLKPDQESVPLPLLAPLGVELPPREIIVSLWRGDQKIEEQHFQFSVQKVARPILHKPDNIVCPAGTSFDFTGRVDRNGCEEPLVVEFAGLKGVRQEKLPSANADSPRVRLIVPADTPPAELVPLNLVLRVADTVADTKALFLSIKEAPPRIGKEVASRFKIEKAPETLSVKAGEKKELAISLARGDYKGPVEVRLEDLPSGVKAAPVTVSAESSSAVVVVEAATDAETGDYAVKVRAVPGEHQLDERTFELQVEKADPPEAAANGGPRWKRVTFSTVDHVELVGSLYAGSKGKKGATVLMLHDLGRGHDRKERGWTRLAEALQAEGHTVLTFDFRGHGESIRVPRKFWESAVNSNFPIVRQTRPQDGLPERIKFADFPPDYLPWLIHDIAAARNFLDLRHDDADGPINTFNMVVIGAGQGAALGTLWLASEGVRFNAVGDVFKMEPLGWEKKSVLRAVWIGMSGKLGRIDVRGWIRQAHQAPVVPVAFVYGDSDQRTSQFLKPLLKDGVIEETVTPKTALSGERLLDPDSEAAEVIRSYLVNTLGAIRPQPWARRQIKRLWSYWVFAPQKKGSPEFYLAKKPEEVMLSFVPLERFDITIAGMQPQKPLMLGMPGR
jgi:hypothetical protein